MPSGKERKDFPAFPAKGRKWRPERAWENLGKAQQLEWPCCRGVGGERCGEQCRKIGWDRSVKGLNS